MIHFYRAENGRLTRMSDVAEGLAALDQVIWIDLLQPEPEEAAALGEVLGVKLPTRADMDEIELSSRLYHEAGAHYLTASVLSLSRVPEPLLAPVTFILAHGRLITLRHHDPKSFTTFTELAFQTPLEIVSGRGVLLALFEVLVDRLADILEAGARRLDTVSATIFGDRHPKSGARRLAVILKDIGKAEALLGHVRESLVSIERLAGYLMLGQDTAGAERARLKTLMRDLRSLLDYAATQAGKITFLLDATLGKISIEQNQILSIFSVVAFVFLPPTLIASIYGMNFAVMPELGWTWGYPAVLALMLLSAVLPYAVFRRKGWL